MQGALEEPMDSIKGKVDQLVQRFKSEDGDSSKEYKRMRELKDKPSTPLRPKSEVVDQQDL